MSNNNGINHAVNDALTSGEKPLCGHVTKVYDMPIRLEHDKARVGQGSNLPPCKKCMEKVEAKS